MLALPGNNLFIVGDDDQSIYRFRGAKPELMLGFERDYPDAKDSPDTNYRCSRQIVEAAGRVISHNRTRFPKEIKAARGNGHPVIIKAWQEPMDETLESSRKYVTMPPWVYPTMTWRCSTDQRGAAAADFQAHGIQHTFYMRDAVPNLYEHWIAGNVISYIRAALGDPEPFQCASNHQPSQALRQPGCPGGQQVSWESVKSFTRTRTG